MRDHPVVQRPLCSYETLRTGDTRPPQQQQQQQEEQRYEQEEPVLT